MIPQKPLTGEQKRDDLSDNRKFWDSLPPEQIEALEASQLLNDRKPETDKTNCNQMTPPKLPDDQNVFKKEYWDTQPPEAYEEFRQYEKFRQSDLFRLKMDAMFPKEVRFSEIDQRLKQAFDNLTPEEKEHIELTRMFTDAEHYVIKIMAEFHDLPLTPKAFRDLEEEYSNEIYANLISAYFGKKLQSIKNLDHRKKEQRDIYRNFELCAQMFERHSTVKLGSITDDDRQRYKDEALMLRLISREVEHMKFETELTLKQKFLVRVFELLGEVHDDDDGNDPTTDVNPNSKYSEFKNPKNRTNPTQNQFKHFKKDYETVIQYMIENDYKSEAIGFAQAEFEKLTKKIAKSKTP